MSKKIIPVIAVCAIALAVILSFTLSPNGPSIDEPYATDPVSGEERKPEYYIQDIEEYNAFLQTSKILPENFITADMLEDFGTLRLFSWNPGSNYNNYYYGINLENGGKLSIRVFHAPKMETKNYLDISQTGKTMREINTNVNGAIASNGFEFFYVPDGLISISWMVNGVEIKLSWNNVLENAPPLSENHILNKIFSKADEDQIAALNQLKAKMETN